MRTFTRCVGVGERLVENRADDDGVDDDNDDGDDDDDEDGYDDDDDDDYDDDDDGWAGWAVGAFAWASDHQIT